MIKIGKQSGIVYYSKKPKNYLQLISWLGTINSIAGAFLVANGIFLVGYCIFASGAILWLIVEKMQKNNAMFFLELVFLIANINGIIINL